MKPVTIQYS